MYRLYSNCCSVCVASLGPSIHFYQVPRRMSPFANVSQEHDNECIKMYQYPREFATVWSPSIKDLRDDIDNLETKLRVSEAVLIRKSESKAKIYAGASSEEEMNIYRVIEVERDSLVRRLKQN